MEKLNTLLQDYKNGLLNEYDLKEYESDWKSFKELVQRLVKNDKIERNNTGYSLLMAQLDTYHGFDEEEQLLMILSIQDNPIEYLCSVLK